MSEKPVASIKTLAKYEPDIVYIGTGEYVAECVRADDGDYYLAADVEAAIEALRAEVDEWKRVAAARSEAEDENERLRAEVREAREFRDKLVKAIGNEQLRAFIEKHGEPVPLTNRVQAAEARAERLEEALRLHIEDLERSAVVLDQYPAMAQTASEMRKAAAELRAALTKENKS